MAKSRTWIGTIIALLGAMGSGIFLANPGFGAAFEIPDVIPFLGNLDEVVVSAIFFSCLSYLGINVLPGARTRVEQESPPRIGSTDADRARSAS